MPDTASEAHKRSFILAGEAVTWQGESEAETEKSGGEDEKSRERKPRQTFISLSWVWECGVRDWQVWLEVDTVDKCLKGFVQHTV